MSKVKLENPTSEVDPIELEVGHAEALLRMSNNGGWTLPKDSPYQYSQENGITKRKPKVSESKE